MNLSMLRDIYVFLCALSGFMMPHLSKWILWMLLATIHQIPILGREVTISPYNLTAREGCNATVRCTYKGEATPEGAAFKLNDTLVANIFPNCTKYYFEEKLVTNCEGNAYTLTLVNISRTYHDQQVWCTIYDKTNPPPTSAHSSILNVIVPIENVSLISNGAEGGVLNVCENSTLRFQCKTSAARPTPNIRWVYKNHLSTKEIKETITMSHTTEEKQLVITSSILIITANRSLNNWQILCKANNYLDEELYSNVIKFNISYPPDTIPVIVNEYGISKNGFDIIEGKQGILSCVVPISEPVATLSWLHVDLNQTVVQHNMSYVIRKLVWEATRHDQKISTCMAKHECNNYNESVHVTRNVLYPPLVNSMDNVSIVEESVLNISCDITEGVPEAYEIRWKRMKDGFEMNSTVLTIGHILRNLSSIYTCTVTNIMEPTVGTIEMGSSSGSIYVEVLYPPTVYPLKNATVIEGSAFNRTCQVSFGNPNNTKLTWSSGDNTIHIGSGILLIGNVSRRHDMVYTCTALNTMRPTDSDHKIGNSSQSFHLNVEYIATVKSFTIEGHGRDSNITVDEHDNVTLICDVDSKPISTSYIELRNGSKAASGSSNNLVYSLGPVKCLDAGRYKCSGWNHHNKMNVSFRRLTLFVKCSPRAHPLYRIKSNITTTLNSQIVMSFSAIAYPLPTVVIWQKFDGNDWNNITSNNDTMISQSSLIFNLTVNNVEQADTGKYRLYISNGIGNVTHNFTITSIVGTILKNGQPPEGNMTGIVIGVLCAIIGVILAVIFMILILKRRQQKNPGKSIYQNVPFVGKATKTNPNTSKTTTVFKETNIDEEGLQEVDDVSYLQTERTEYYNSLDKIEKIDRIQVSELFQYVNGKNEDEFAIEYQKIPTELQMSCTFARKPENIALNRYNGIYPYDHSRVKIPTHPDFFMNACYIDGFNRRNAYIASLGPTEKTTDKYVTFWQMVWHEKSDIIVMLTNLREPSGMKCEQYWPDDGSLTYGEISVSCVNKEVFAEYTVRTFILSNTKENYTVTQLHYTAWPDKTVPEDATSLLEFRERIIATPTTSKGPIIIHCSAGIGRTGTLIAIDILVAEGRNKRSVNVFECVTSMRKQRVKMVQTSEQYTFIYKALVTALSFDCKEIRVKDFPKLIDASKSSKYSTQYQKLRLTVEKDRKDERESRAKNEKHVDKNRFGADIPGDRFRVFLYLDSEGDANYINAVYINSLKKKDMFIMGQTPLPNTVKDFLCMIYQENCICIVTMDDLNWSDKTIGKYIFEDGRKHAFGNFNVSSSILETKHHYILREMKVKYDGKYDRGEKKVFHFQYKQWLEESDIPNNADDFVSFVQEIQEYANELGDETSHILVHCLKANERSGMFCAVAIIMEMLQVHDCASVTNTVRRIRTRRRSAITSQEQLLFCYQAGGEFIKQLGR